MEKKTKHCQKHGIELHSTRRQTMKHKTTTPRGKKKTKHCQKHGIELHSTRRQTMKHKTTTPRGKKLEQQDKVYNGSQGSF